MNVCRKKYFIAFTIVLLELQVFSVAAQQIKRPPLVGIAFVELQVSELKKSKVFYNDLLGYTIIPGREGAEKKIHSFEIQINTRQSVKVCDGLPSGKDERFISVAFQTSDAEAMRLYLQSKNVQVPVSVHKENGFLWFAVNDPDNHPVKFVQYKTNANEQPVIQQRAISARILHAGLTIVSAAAADAFYKDILGFSEIWRGGSSDSITSWINMRLPESTDYLEYMLATGPVSRQQLGGAHHIALMVPDMQQALDILNGRAAISGYELAAPRIGRNKRWQLNLFDPDGTRIELMEPFPMR
jgi:catechol 2,3-dioxygenase-like lactoylglutathione lyase family enzyme